MEKPTSQITQPQYIVGIVVDPNFGKRLDQLAARLPIWIVDTPINRTAAERWWQTKDVSSHTEPGAVTTFGVDPSETPEEWCDNILPAVDRHHDEHSHDPPCDAIEVVGARITDTLREALSNLGFTEVEPLEAGFKARRVRPTL